MERPPIMKTINGNPSRQPMMNIMETSLHCRSFSQKNNLQDASFSSYLRPEATKAGSGEDIGCSVDDSDQISVFDAESYFNESNEQKENKRVVSSGVNNASRDGAPTERCGFSTVSRLSSVSSIDGYGRNHRAHSFHATPTASSEASWNSQTGLLSNPPGSIAVSLRNLPADNYQKKGGSRSTATKWFFGRKCPCSGKKSVQVKEKLSEPRTPLTSYPKRQSPRSVDQSVAEKQFVESQRNSLTQDGVERTSEKVIPILRRFSSENHFASNITPQLRHQQQVLGSLNDGTGFSFPILNQSSKLELKGIPTSPREDPPRDSLEVFQPPDHESVSSKSMEVQQRALGSHAGGVDRDRRGFAFPASPMSRITGTDDDVASDASSDLFEIESFSTQPSSYPMYRRRDSLDDATTFNARRIAAAAGANGGLYCRHSLDEPVTPSVAATECYEPSEASIDWSVTTAEGFERASITNLSISASDIDEFATIRHHHEKTGGIRVGGGGGDVSKWRSGNGGLLLSCRCEKAVSVGPHPVKCMQIQQEGGPRAVGLGIGGPPPHPHLPLISTLRHVSSDSASSRPPQNVVVGNNNKPPLARSRSALLSLAFATKPT